MLLGALLLPLGRTLGFGNAPAHALAPSAFRGASCGAGSVADSAAGDPAVSFSFPFKSNPLLFFSITVMLHVPTFGWRR